MKRKDRPDDTKWTFGACIQATRYGFHQLPGYRLGLLRISPLGKHILCELRPLARVPLSLKGREHYVWWAENGGADVVMASPFLRGVKAVHKPFTVLLDNDGNRVLP